MLIADKDGEKRFRIIALDDFEKSMSIQPRNTLVLEPDKGTFVYAEILSAEQVGTLNEDKLSLKEFDQYNAGRRWNIPFINRMWKYSVLCVDYFLIIE